MAKPLRSQLNQIRAWVRQGRTDAWIAHQLEVSTSELREFRRRHELDADGEDVGEADLRDEIEAEIEAAAREAEDEDDDEDEASEDEDDDRDDDDDGDDENGERKGGAQREGTGRRRRRRRRGGRGRGRAGVSMQATFDHGDEGYGLWLDPAIADDPVYTEHWSGHRPVEVSVEPDRIVIRRTGASPASGDSNGSDDDE